MTYQTINPYTNELVKEYPFATDDELEATLAQAETAFQNGKKQSLAERSKILHNIAATFRKHSEELAKICTIDMGKLVAESAGEVELCAMIADWYADQAEELLKPDKLETRFPGEAEVLHQPRGVIMMVEPWNFPYYQIMRVFAPNYMIGNTMILKHASNTPTSAKRFCEMVEEGGAAKGCLTNLFLTYDQVTKAIEDPRVQGAALTGSARGGKSVAMAAAQSLKPSSMELGGMDAFIVLDDANMDEVNAVSCGARLQNSGQVCISSKRFIVMDNVYDQFLSSLIDSFSKVKPGDPLDPSTTFAPMCTKHAKEKLQSQFDAALKAGAKLEYQYPEIDSEGQFFRPAILSNVTRDNPVYDDEMFGPVAMVFRVHSEQEAIDLANDNSYGLGGSVFTSDPDRGVRVAAQIDTGSVYVNNPTTTLPELPFGGVKLSGYGNELGRAGILAFSTEKMVMKSAHPAGM
ncbi:NAD-dependent succinate-semialdehyde dehydrogenase [Bifidobacterium sp. ESL0732]|uniref:NAD-dependent succinate-semialdehyde dehydrogenase n=1 Tax=Bifidobacterium sp. ESL0732 TaxID=2983222 RepID=UPI0023F8B672|nr:NAD-dependent succinate-semialdehyde dehydrogenase [Bifidobacterium sp. ESL0732]WEV64548.1 NAD-dependent succinate-semialdehyde dehydrogenase [Bifidobacterium sp. ESL0732]